MHSSRAGATFVSLQLLAILSVGLGAPASAQLGNVVSVELDPPFITWLDDAMVRVSGSYCAFTGLGQAWKGPVDAEGVVTVTLPVEHACGLADPPQQVSFSEEAQLPPLSGRNEYVLRIVDGVSGSELFTQEIEVYEPSNQKIEFEEPVLSGHEVEANLIAYTDVPFQLKEVAFPFEGIIVVEGNQCCASGLSLPYLVFERTLALGPLPPGHYDLYVLTGNTTLATTSFTVYDPDRCVPSATTLCLHDNRFSVSADWRSWGAASGQGAALPSSTGDEAGAFSTLAAGQPDASLRIVDRCAREGFYWVYTSWLTRLGVELLVTDTASDVTRVYDKPLNANVPPVSDRFAFACA
jgi:hypothetical protein